MEFLGYILALSVGLLLGYIFNVSSAEKKKPATIPDESHTDAQITEQLGDVYPNRFGTHYRKVYRAGYHEGYKDSKLDTGH